MDLPFDLTAELTRLILLASVMATALFDGLKTYFTFVDTMNDTAKKIAAAVLSALVGFLVVSTSMGASLTTGEKIMVVVLTVLGQAGVFRTLKRNAGGTDASTSVNTEPT